MIIYLAGHALHLLADTLRQFGISSGFGAVSLVRQQCEGSLEAVGKITRGCDGASNGFLAIFEQRVQIVNQGLDFAWVCALHAESLTDTNSRQPFPQPPEGQQALAQSEESRNHQKDACEDGSACVGCADAWKNVDEHQRHHVH
jgi:hypothetical protein